MVSAGETPLGGDGGGVVVVGGAVVVVVVEVVEVVEVMGSVVVVDPSPAVWTEALVLVTSPVPPDEAPFAAEGAKKAIIETNVAIGIARRNDRRTVAFISGPLLLTCGIGRKH